MRRVVAGLLVLCIAALGVGGYRLLASEVEADVYRARLAVLADDYATLRSRYEQLVRETAVTELVVEDGTLSVSIRGADGELERIATPFDPAREIYVDFVVRDGRLWIRRIFDDRTPPSTAVVIDPSLAELDWRLEDEAGSYGKAAYRALGEGRWVVRSSGDGSLVLARVAPGEQVELAPPPPLRRFAPIEDDVQGALARIGPREVWRALLARLHGRSGPSATD